MGPARFFVLAGGVEERAEEADEAEEIGAGEAEEVGDSELGEAELGEVEVIAEWVAEPTSSREKGPFVARTVLKLVTATN
jgi:hypothetical protein